MAQKRDYYEVLGVQKTASADEIKSAYRKLARRRRPQKRTSKRPLKHILCLATQTRGHATTSSDSRELSLWAAVPEDSRTSTSTISCVRYSEKVDSRSAAASVISSAVLLAAATHHPQQGNPGEGISGPVSALLWKR